MSSEAEAFGRVTVESMMGGCLVIGSNSGATPEIIDNGKCGILFKCKDSNDLAQKMKMVIDMEKKELQNRKLKSSDYAAAHFSSYQNAQKIINCYKEILDNR